MQHNCRYTVLLTITVSGAHYEEPIAGEEVQLSGKVTVLLTITVGIAMWKSTLFAVGKLAKWQKPATNNTC